MVLRNFLFVLVFFFAFNAFGQTSPQPGVIDATNFDFGNKRLNLSGTWIWYDGKLLSPSEVKYNDGLPTEVPGTWNERRGSGSGQGCATYKLTIIISPASEQLALEMPDIYSAYVLYENGVEITRNGTPGKTAQATKPQWKPGVVPLNHKSDTIQLILQIANFNHHKGGMKEPILMSSASILAQKEFLSMTGKAIAVGLLLNNDRTTHVIQSIEK